MKSLLFILFLLLKMSTAVDICDVLKGDVMISEAFRWKDKLFIFPPNGTGVRVDFKWSESEFSFGNTTEVDSKYWNFGQLRYVFTVDYPGKGGRAVAVDWEESAPIPELVAHLIDIDINGIASSKEKIIINPYKCYPKVEPMGLCTLFTKFPEDGLENQLLSLSSLPSDNTSVVSQRFFAFYKEIPPKNESNSCKDCYQSKRYIFMERNTTVDNETTIDWVIDNSTVKDFKCEDLNGTLVNASTTLSDYRVNQFWRKFDFIEFIGDEYRTYELSLFLNKVVDIQLLKSGSIRKLFGCPPLPTTTSAPQTSEGNGSITTSGSASDIQSGTSGASPLVSSEVPDKGIIGSTTTERPEVNYFPGLLILIILLFVVVFIGIFIYFLVFRKQSSAKPQQQTVDTTAQPSEEAQENPETTQSVRSDIETPSADSSTLPSKPITGVDATETASSDVSQKPSPPVSEGPPSTQSVQSVPGDSSAAN